MFKGENDIQRSPFRNRILFGSPKQQKLSSHQSRLAIHFQNLTISLNTEQVHSNFSHIIQKCSSTQELNTFLDLAI